MTTRSPDAERQLSQPAGPGGSLGRAIFDRPVRFGVRSRTVEPAGGPGRHDLPGHLAAYGGRPDATRAGGPALLAALAASGLTGHGGGHFPVARKWRAALAAGGGGTIVANCAEGEPASAKDAALLQLRPHLVLDGLALAAETMSTRRAVLWLHENDRTVLESLQRAMAERRRASPLDVAVTIAVGPDHYLSGESSAVARALSGGPALPFLPRQHLAAGGPDGRPTLVHNAETLARVALVARAGQSGGEWGDGPLEPADGSLVTVVGAAHRAVLATRAGETFTDLLARSAVVADRPAAVLLGGYGGSWVPWSELAGVEVGEAQLRARGASLGAGVIAPLSAGRCGLTETARVLDFLTASSARQCGPCLFGLPAVTELFHRLVAGRFSRGDRRRLEAYAGQVAGRGACHHPDGAVRLLRSALHTFEADVQRHLADGPCAGASRPALLPVPAAPAGGS